MVSGAGASPWIGLGGQAHYYAHPSIILTASPQKGRA